MTTRKLEPQEIECRVATVSEKGCSLLLYKTARVDRAILDETYGTLWQNDFKVIDGKMYGGIGIYNSELKEWLWRWDCGTESNQDAEKGQASDCFKRAGFKWGIGIELYSAPFIFVGVETTYNNTKKKYELKDRFMKFSVSKISYDEKGNIDEVVIVDSKGNVVYPRFSNAKTKSKSKQEPEIIPADDSYIYENLLKCTTQEEAHVYFKTYENKVNDVAKFKKTYADLYLKLKQPKEWTIEEIKAKLKKLKTKDAVDNFFETLPLADQNTEEVCAYFRIRKREISTGEELGFKCVECGREVSYDVYTYCMQNLKGGKILCLSCQKKHKANFAKAV